MVWLGAGILCIASAMILFWPLWRGSRGIASRMLYHRAVYRDQLAEIDADLAIGEIDEQSARLAKAEIGRRVLAESSPVSETPQSKVPRWAMAAVLLAPLAALALYGWVGHPRPIAANHATDNAAEMDALTAKLAAKLQENPDDLEGWKLLARSYTEIGRFRDAAEAYRHALAVDRQHDANLIGDFAESLSMANNAVIPEARRAFEAILENDPKNARARYYLAEERAEAGALDEALTRWRDLAKDTAADAQYLPLIRGRIAEMARRLGRDPAQALADLPQPQGASPSEAAPAEAESEQSQSAMIEGMVARLAQRLESEPNDLEGWLKLGRAELVLGHADQAISAYDHALSLDPQRLEALTGKARALRQSAGAEDERYFEALRQVLARDPEDAEALLVLGGEALKKGDRAQAVEKWNRLLAGLPKSEPERADILERMREIAASVQANPEGLIPKE